MSERRLRALALALFALGAVLLLVAEATWLRLAGSLVLGGYVIVALFAIATPDFLAADRKRPPASGRGP